MAMTREHYSEMAGIIKSIRQDYQVHSSPDPLFPLAMDALAGRLALVFRQDNPLFDVEEFKEACQAQEATPE